MTTLTFTLGDRMRKSREAAAMTQRELATRLGISKNTVTRYEHEQTRPPKWLLQGWASETRVDAEWLIGDEEAA